MFFDQDIEIDVSEFFIPSFIKNYGNNKRRKENINKSKPKAISPRPHREFQLQKIHSQKLQIAKNFSYGLPFTCKHKGIS